MDSALRYIGIALLLVVSVVAFGLCAEGFDAECEHLCCRGATSVRPLRALAKLLLPALACASGALLAMRGEFTPFNSAADAAGVAPVLGRIATLQI